MSDPTDSRDPAAGVQRGDGREPLAARVLGSGVRAGRRVVGATGVDQALDVGVEEAIVRAMESPAVERALIRLAEDGRLQGVIERAVASTDVEDLVDRAISSDAADRIWIQILASDKAQMLVERIAEAPEVRAAIAQQGFGLISDIGLQVRRLTRPLDRVLERLARGLLRRPPRAGKTRYAGLVTRLLAAAIDLVLLVGGLALAWAVLASITTALFGPGDGLGATAAAAVVILGYGVAGALIASFWALAGQTPGMRFLGIYLDAEGERRIGMRRALRRLFAVPFALLPAGLGFLSILIQDERRGWHDQFAGTVVLYDDDAKVAPYSEG
jgi:uncharacterized RDD family membrane protein YckC